MTINSVPQSPAPLCPVHDVPMAPSKFGGHYCRERDESQPRGFCTEKVRASQAAPVPISSAEPGVADAVAALAVAVVALAEAIRERGLS